MPLLAVANMLLLHKHGKLKALTSLHKAGHRYRKQIALASRLPPARAFALVREQAHFECLVALTLAAPEPQHAPFVLHAPDAHILVSEPALLDPAHGRAIG